MTDFRNDDPFGGFPGSEDDLNYRAADGEEYDAPVGAVVAVYVASELRRIAARGHGRGITHPAELLDLARQLEEVAQ